MSPLIGLDALSAKGSGLQRPECVLAFADGSLFVSERGFGIRWIRPDGSQWRAGTADPAFVPNGFALGDDGRFVIANIGDAGGVWQLGDDGTLRSLSPALEGRPVNFVGRGPDDALWASISTRHVPRHLAYRLDVRDGFIVRLDDMATVIADGLAYANEFRVSPDRRWLYVSETMSFRISRFAITPQGLGQRETVLAVPEGWFADGIVFDGEGGLWVACIVANAVLRLSPQGERTLIVAECDAAWIAAVRQAFLDEGMGRVHFDTVPGNVLGNVTSMAFGGKQLQTLYFGSLAGSAIPYVDVPWRGVASPHWDITPVTTAFVQRCG